MTRVTDAGARTRMNAPEGVLDPSGSGVAAPVCTMLGVATVLRAFGSLCDSCVTSPRRIAAPRTAMVAKTGCSSRGLVTVTTTRGRCPPDAACTVADALVPSSQLGAGSPSSLVKLTRSADATVRTAVPPMCGWYNSKA